MITITQSLIKVIHVFKEIIIEVNIRPAFEALRLQFKIMHEFDAFLFGDQKLKKNEKFTELRSLNFIPEKLSKH
jgi:hypothetical protein